MQVWITQYAGEDDEAYVVEVHSGRESALSSIVAHARNLIEDAPGAREVRIAPYPNDRLDSECTLVSIDDTTRWTVFPREVL